MVNDLDYQNITFAVSKKDDSKIEKKTIFALIYFVTKTIWFILFMYQIKYLKIA